jgi:hypothetical protein
MRKIILISFLCIFALAFTACGKESDLPMIGVVPSIGDGGISTGDEISEPAQEEFSSETPATENNTGFPSDDLILHFVQREAGGGAATGSAKGYVTLKTDDNTFQMEFEMYDGYAVINGSYTEDDSAYTLTPESSEAFNLSVEDIGEIIFEKNGTELTYKGATIGETYEGAKFRLDR